MSPAELRVTYVGGPTAILELAGVRFLTDPTLDAAPRDYETPAYTLHKTQSPAVAADALGAIDAVLLSHDHHWDNLDVAGRAALARAGRVLTTVAGAERLGGGAEGLVPWQSVAVAGTGGATVRVTATPARHGPEGGDRGPVIGFLLEPATGGGPVVYVSGDTVWFDGVAEVARRFAVDVAVLFCGAAKVAVAGPSPLTFTAEEAVVAARAFPHAAIVPLHCEGWTHFSEACADVGRAFAAARLADRLRWPPPGVPTAIAPR